jgi:uncharacterized protein (DUF697 family)
MSRKQKNKKLLRPGIVLGLLRELKAAAKDDRPLVVAGAPSLASALRREIAAGGDSRAVREDPADGAAAVVYVLAGPVGDPETRALRDASRARVPIVCVAVGVRPEDGPIPYVLPTDVVEVPPGQGFPVAEIARAIVRELGEEGTALAARLPVLREPLCEYLVESFARRNALIGAATFVPGEDMPALTVNQMRLVMRIASAHGLEPEPERALELAGVLGGGFGFRALGRALLARIPAAGWALRAAVAYTGTRALGEAAMRYYAQRP